MIGNNDSFNNYNQNPENYSSPKFNNNNNNLLNDQLKEKFK